MEGESKDCFSGENGSSSESQCRGRPPNPSLAAAYRQCFSIDRVAVPCNKSLVRHPSLVSFLQSLPLFGKELCF